VMARLSVVHEKLAKEGKLGTSLRLLPTTAATTLRGGGIIIDGPFAETKEQLLGFYVIDVENLDAALDVRGNSPPPIPPASMRSGPSHFTFPICGPTRPPR